MNGDCRAIVFFFSCDIINFSLLDNHRYLSPFSINQISFKQSNVVKCYSNNKPIVEITLSEQQKRIKKNE